MPIRERIKKFFSAFLFNPKWKCSVCGVENFSDSIFCEKCERELPFNDGYICAHCGRKTIAATAFCSTCAEKMTAIDRARSVFVYEKSIPKLIMGLKYFNQRYLVTYFGEKLANLYLQNYFGADFIGYIPMTDKALSKRGYNQSRLLAEEVSKITSVPLYDGIEKVKETKRQAKLNRQERLKNLEGAFRVFERAKIKDKEIVLIDDVSTTGATAQAIADKLKRAGAKRVYLITVASTPPFEKY